MAYENDDDMLDLKDRITYEIRGQMTVVTRVLGILIATHPRREKIMEDLATYDIDVMGVAAGNSPSETETYQRQMEENLKAMRQHAKMTAELIHMIAEQHAE